MKELKSFRCALKGITRCIKNERHMRIHICASLYVLLFSTFFNLSVEKYAILILTISAVISAEMVNTSVEVLSDICAENYNRMAKVAKDIAAGAVFVFALAAVAIGIMFFGDIYVLWSIMIFFWDHKVLLMLMILSLVLSGFFIMIGPIEIKNRVKTIIFKQKQKNKG